MDALTCERGLVVLAALLEGSHQGGLEPARLGPGCHGPAEEASADTREG